jgi:outer membrane protein assembly factor BamB/adenine/guanine phosphoribosyltransferase-like PRPP-binding protein
MNVCNKDDNKIFLQTLIQEHVLIKDYNGDSPGFDNLRWIFDFRKIILNPEYLMLITTFFWEKIKHYNDIQIGGIETASIPLITSLILEAKKNGKNVNGFYIRKSRKKSGLYKQIEGTLNENPIILIDDLINSSSSVVKQVEILEQLNKKVTTVLTIVLFRDVIFYDFLNKRNIKIENIFSLKDFNLSLSNYDPFNINPYQRKILYVPGVYSYKNVVPKSTPAIVGDFIYLGTDESLFLCLDKKNGHIKWKRKVGYSSKGKSILSSPLVYEDLVFFGSYDGNLYALDRFYGEIRWVFKDADFIGSSPVVAKDLNLLFIGLEYGLSGSHGSLAAIDVYTGEKKWEHRTPAFTHASPLYIPELKVVCCGGNEGILRMFNATNGVLLWQFETEGGSYYSGFSGFGRGDIKMAPVYDKDMDLIAFCSMDGWMYVLKRSTGSLHFKASTDYNDTDYRTGIYGEPVFTKKFVIFAGLDKYIYCYDKNSGILVWKYLTGGRIFSTPVEVGEFIFVGSNDGRLYEIITETGVLASYTQFSERITNKIIYESDEKKIYVNTQLSQLYVLMYNKN